VPRDPEDHFFAPCKVVLNGNAEKLLALICTEFDSNTAQTDRFD
jgi:hypothetical protein